MKAFSFSSLSVALLSCFVFTMAQAEELSQESESALFQEELVLFEEEVFEKPIETMKEAVVSVPPALVEQQTRESAFDAPPVSPQTSSAQPVDVELNKTPVALAAPTTPRVESKSELSTKDQDMDEPLPALEIASFEMSDDVQELPLLAATLEKIAPISEEPTGFEINLEQVFAGAPIIYSLLLAMSVVSVFIWLYSLISLRSTGAMPDALVKQLRNKLNSNQYEEALNLCLQHPNFFCKMLASAISSRKHGLHAMLESMKSEGQRATVVFWQRLALLNDIAIVAPMFGLLGTVIGMFYAFYDIHRSMKSMSTFFDGLGISVGTTVAGLVVAIASLILHSIAKYRLVRHLSHVENEAQSLAALMDNRSSIYDNK